MTKYHKKRLHKQERRPYRPRFNDLGHPINPNSFAQAAAAEEFGSARHFAWRQWSAFQDQAPADIARRRALCAMEAKLGRLPNRQDETPVVPVGTEISVSTYEVGR